MRSDVAFCSALKGRKGRKTSAEINGHYVRAVRGAFFSEQGERGGGADGFRPRRTKVRKDDEHDSSPSRSAKTKEEERICSQEGSKGRATPASRAAAANHRGSTTSFAASTSAATNGERVDTKHAKTFDSTSHCVVFL